MDIPNEAIIKFWNEEMYTFDNNKISKYPFKQDTIEFLCNVGLPNLQKVIQNESVHFYLCDAFSIITNLGENFILIGEFDNGFSKLCIRESSQEVGSINKKGDYKYINSSIRTFVIFKQIFYSELSNTKNLNTDEEARYRFAQKVRKSFYNIDPKSVENPDIIESVESMEKPFELYSYWDSILYFYEEDYLVMKDLE